MDNGLIRIVVALVLNTIFHINYLTIDPTVLPLPPDVWLGYAASFLLTDVIITAAEPAATCLYRQ